MHSEGTQHSVHNVIYSLSLDESECQGQGIVIKTKKPRSLKMFGEKPRVQGKAAASFLQSAVTQPASRFSNRVSPIQY